MCNSTLKFIAVVLVFDALIYLSKMSSSGVGVNGERFDLGAQWNCAHVIQNPIEVRRELVSRNLEGDHKIIKFIENCIKSVDGWRFKKSAPTSRPTDSGSASAAGNSLAAPAKLENLLNDDMLPYPMRFVLFGELPKEKLSGSDKESHKETRNKQQHHQRQQSWTVSSQPLSQSRQELQSEGQYLGFSE